MTIIEIFQDLDSSMYKSCCTALVNIFINSENSRRAIKTIHMFIFMQRKIYYQKH